MCFGQFLRQFFCVAWFQRGIFQRSSGVLIIFFPVQEVEDDLLLFQIFP